MFYKSIIFQKKKNNIFFTWQNYYFYFLLLFKNIQQMIENMMKYFIFNSVKINFLRKINKYEFHWIGRFIISGVFT